MSVGAELDYAPDIRRPLEYVPRLVTAPSPAAGAEFTIPVPAGVIWLVYSVAAFLTASAAAATRTSSITFTDGSLVFAAIPQVNTVTANQTVRCSWIRNLGASTGSGAQHRIAFPLGEITLYGGLQIVSATDTIQAADQWTQVCAYVLEVTEQAFSTDLFDTERGMDLMRKSRAW